MNRNLFSLLSLVIVAPAIAESLIETNSDFDGLPEIVEFDCFPSVGSAKKYFEPLNRRMLIPQNFEQSPDDPSWINWNVKIIGEKESVVFPFAAIQFGSLDVGMNWIEDEFTLVSPSSENGFEVDIYLRAPQPEDTAKDHWLFLVAEGKFLKVIARTEIDWNSLLTCFE